MNSKQNTVNNSQAFKSEPHWKLILQSQEKTMKMFDFIDTFLITEIFKFDPFDSDDKLVIPDGLWEYYESMSDDESEIMINCYNAIKSRIEELLLDLIMSNDIFYNMLCSLIDDTIDLNLRIMDDSDPNFQSAIAMLHSEEAIHSEANNSEESTNNHSKSDSNFKGDLNSQNIQHPKLLKLLNPEDLGRLRLLNLKLRIMALEIKSLFIKTLDEFIDSLNKN